MPGRHRWVDYRQVSEPRSEATTARIPPSDRRKREYLLVERSEHTSAAGKDSPSAPKGARESPRAKERSDDGENPSARSGNTPSEARIPAPQARRSEAVVGRLSIPSSEARPPAPQAKIPRARRRARESHLEPRSEATTVRIPPREARTPAPHPCPEAVAGRPRSRLLSSVSENQREHSENVRLGRNPASIEASQAGTSSTSWYDRESKAFARVRSKRDRLVQQSQKQTRRFQGYHRMAAIDVSSPARGTRAYGKRTRRRRGGGATEMQSNLVMVDSRSVQNGKTM